MKWVSRIGIALLAVAAVFAGVMARLAGESVWLSVAMFVTAAGCLGYLVVAWRQREPSVTGRAEQLAAEARRYHLDALVALGAALTDEDPRVGIAVGEEPTSYRLGPDRKPVALYSHWDALLNSLNEHGYLIDWDWDEPPAEVFEWCCEAVGRRWPGVELRELARAQGQLGSWTSTASNRNRDEPSVDSPQTLDGYLAPCGIRVGWFDNGQAITLFVVGQRGFDRIAALQRDFHLARPVSVQGIERKLFRR